MQVDIQPILLSRDDTDQLIVIIFCLFTTFQKYFFLNKMRNSQPKYFENNRAIFSSYQLENIT